MPFLECLIAWFLTSLLVGVFARVRRNRSGFGWFLLSFLVVSPVFAGILVAILREKQKPSLVQ